MLVNKRFPRLATETFFLYGTSMAIAQVFAQKQLGMRQQRKDGIPYFISCVALPTHTKRDRGAQKPPFSLGNPDIASLNLRNP